MSILFRYSVIFIFSVMAGVTESYAQTGPLRVILNQILNPRPAPRPVPRPAPRPVPPPIVRPQPPRPLPPPVQPPRPPIPPPRPVPGPFNPQEPPQVAMLDVYYSGTGCADGTLVSVMSPDQQVVSLLFNDFVTQAGPATGRRQDIRSCRIHIPLEIYNGGYQAMITRVDFRGVASLPVGAVMQASGSYSITSPDYPNIRPQSFSVETNNIFGPAFEDYLFSVEPIENNGLPPSMSGETKWSACTSRMNLAIDAELLLQNPYMEEDALSTIDSIDAVVAPGIEYQIKWRRCR